MDKKIVRPANIPHFRRKIRTSKQGRAYEKYMASPEWAAKKNEYWEVAGRHCQACGNEEQLHVHHHTYARLGHELLTDLVGLCQEHHEEVHAIHRVNKGLSLTRATEIVTGQKYSLSKSSVTKKDICPNCKAIVRGVLLYRKVNGKSVRVKKDCTRCLADEVTPDRPAPGAVGVWRRNAGRCGGCSVTDLRPGMEVTFIRVMKPPTRRYVWIAVDCPHCQSLINR